MKNAVEQENIITIESSDWERILNGEKWVLFQKDIYLSKKQKVENNDPDTNPYIIYTSGHVYLKDSKTDLILGEATIDSTYFLLYENGKGNGLDHELAYARNEAIKGIYYSWCTKKSLKPNPKEGWFKSKKFSAYLDKIGWGGNYALFLTDVVVYKYETESVECPWCEREQKIYVQKQTLGRTSHKCEGCGISFAIWHLSEGSNNK